MFSTFSDDRPNDYGSQHLQTTYTRRCDETSHVVRGKFEIFVQCFYQKEGKQNNEQKTFFQYRILLK